MGFKELISIPTAENINSRVKYIVIVLILCILILTLVTLGGSNKLLTTLVYLLSIIAAGYAGFNILYFDVKNE